MLSFKKSLVKDSLMSMVAFSGQWGLAFLTFLFLLKILKVEEIGQWVIYMSFLTFIEVFRNGLVQNAYIFKAKNKLSERGRLNSTCLFLLVFASLIGYFMLFIPGEWLSVLFKSPELNLLILPCIIYLLITSVVRIFEFGWICDSRFDLLAVTRISYGISFLSLIVVFYLSNKLTLIILPYLQIISGFIALIIVWLLSNKERFLAIRIDEVISVVKYGRFVAGTNLVSIILNKSDIYIIGFLIGPGAVAIYNTASKMINIIEIPLTSISQSQFSKISAAYQDNNTLLTMRNIGLGIVMSSVVLLPIIIVVAVFSDSIINLIAGPEFSESAIVLRILAIFVFVKILGRFSGITLDAIGKPNYNFYILLVTLGVNVILNFILIENYGIYGIAYATSISWLLGSLLSSLVLLKSSINIYQSINNELISLKHKALNYLTNKNHVFKIWN